METLKKEEHLHFVSMILSSDRLKEVFHNLKREQVTQGKSGLCSCLTTRRLHWFDPRSSFIEITRSLVYSTNMDNFDWCMEFKE